MGRERNIARIAKAASHKLPGKSSLNVSFVCPVCPACPVYPVCPMSTMNNMTTMTTMTAKTP